MRKAFIGLLVSIGCLFAVSPNDHKDVDKRLNEASVIFSEIMSAPDRGIPRDLLNKAHCAVIVPGVKKGAFIVGAQYGKGFITCRENAVRGWSAPAAIRIEGGSFGFQIGGSESDVVMLVMNSRGADRLMQSQFTLGGEGEVAAGPVGRNTTAQTDAKFTAEILSWARARGVFAGIAIKGATLRQDVDDNEAMYRKRLETRDIVRTRIAPTEAGRRLIASLGASSPRGKS
jgi:lipid-binding SYLF domain-containing protein